MWDRLEDIATSYLAWLLTGITAGTVWMVRRVFTNEKQIEMLQREIEVAAQHRCEDRKLMQETRDDVKEIRNDVKTLWQER